MNIIFSKLPLEIINYICLYDDHFIMRKGELISIISKNDYRYKLVNFITFKFESSCKFYNNMIAYNYFFPNLYTYKGRVKHNSDLIEVRINENKDFIKYSIWIGKQYPTSINCSNKKQMYYIENPLDYNWVYIEYDYIRR
jgi:hypothetical protein